ncbi:MAG: hypothetical protein WBY93_22875 [Candidatus Binatus sp.]
MPTEEEDLKNAWTAGCSVEEWRRRRQVALSSREEVTAGGFVMSKVGPGGRLVSMSGSAVGEDENMDATQCAAEAKGHLEKFLSDPQDEDSHESLARCGAMVSAALSRIARDKGQAARIASGMGLRR